MVGVVGSSPIAPTKYRNEIKHLAETLGAFFIGLLETHEDLIQLKAYFLRVMEFVVCI
jgi:hypothetical protein